MQSKKREHALLATLLVICFSYAPSATGYEWFALNEAPPLPAGIRYLNEGVEGDYDLRLRCRLVEAKARLLFVLNRQEIEENYYRLTVGKNRCELTKIQLGLEVPLASVNVSLPRGDFQLLIRRRGSLLRLFSDDRLLLTTSDSSYQGGTAGFQVVGEARVDSPQLQPVQPVVFEDDFMRAEGDQGEWQPLAGKWQVWSLENPLRSANAFTYIARAAGGKRAISVAGRWFWNDYHLKAAAMCKGNSAIGLIAYFRDPGNYLLFEWTGGKGGERRLIRCRNGQAQLLTKTAGGYLAGQWYDLSLVVHEGNIEALVDGRTVCKATTEPLPGGMIGLCALGREEVQFDDVRCFSVADMSCNFRTMAPPSGKAWLSLTEASAGQWQERGGEWQLVRRPDGTTCCRAVASSVARAVTGESTWDDYQISTTFAPPRVGSAGICLLYQGEDQHYLFRSTPDQPGNYELVCVTDGQESVVAKAEAIPASEAWQAHRLTVTVNRHLISASVDGRRLIEWCDPSTQGGKVGLFAAGGAQVEFADFNVAFDQHEPPPVFTVHEVFEGEVSMANWAAAQSDWKTEKATVRGVSTEINWHRAPFPGDVEIEAEYQPVQKTLALLVNAADSAEPESGYLLSIDDKGMSLFRRDEEIKRCSCSIGAAGSAVRLRRSGNTVMGILDGRPLIAWTDPQPLTGERVGWFVTGADLDKAKVQVFSNNVLTDTFRQAPSEWRTAGGAWAVQKRWQCDPRWSFFSGENFDGPAVLWHKRSFRGDITVEFAAAIKMRRERGSYTSYGRDINISLCADGQDVDSGYSFVFAGWGNKRNAILRQGKVVAEASAPLLTEDIHRKWFLIRAEKRGGKLRFFIDDALACEYDDAQPLSGDRIALWTYRCGIMVSRFRLSAQEIGTKESPDVSWATLSHTFYDTGS